LKAKLPSLLLRIGHYTSRRRLCGGRVARTRGLRQHSSPTMMRLHRSLRIAVLTVLLVVFATGTDSAASGQAGDALVAELDAERFRAYAASRRQQSSRGGPGDADGDATPPPAAGEAAAAAPAPPADPPAAAKPDAAGDKPKGAVTEGGSDECDVCTYALENKEMLQPYLCRGLRDQAQQMAVSCGSRT